jgi:hypothetical protein
MTNKLPIPSSIFKGVALLFCFLSIFWSKTYAVPLSGTYAVPSIGYPTLASIITDLNSQGISSSVTVNIGAGMGYSEVAPVGGFVLGSSTLNTSISSLITLTIQKDITATANPLLAAQTGVGSYDAIFIIKGVDYLTIDGIDLNESVGNINNTTWMEYGYQMTKLNAGSPVDGCQNNTIKNCLISLTRLNAGNAPVPGGVLPYGSVGIGVTNYLPGTNTSLALATSDDVNSNNKIYSNTITNCYHGVYFYGFANAAPFTLYDQNNDIGGSSLATANTINNFGGSTFVAYGVYALFNNNINISYNTIDNAAGVGGTGAITTLAGMFVSSSTTLGAATANITFNTVKVSSGAAATGTGFCINVATTGNNITSNNVLRAATLTTGVAYAFTLISHGGFQTSQTISNNSFDNITISTTGTFNGIATSNTTQNSIVSGNFINGTMNRTINGGTTTFITDPGLPTAGTHTISGNNFSSFTNLVSGTTTGININSGAASGVGPNLIITGNTISNFNTAGIITGIANSFGNINTVQNNVVTGLTSTTGSIIGISMTTGMIAGTVSGNTVNTLASGGTAAITGINITGSTTTIGGIYIYNNKIYGINHTTTTTGTINGMILGSGCPNINAYNNTIGELTAPAGSSATDQIRGINVSSTSALTNINISYNSIYLSGTSSGTNFSTTDVFHNANATATTATLNLRNNIIINLCTPKGTGKAAALRRSLAATLANYGALSDKNLLYAGTPSASNVIMFDGTNVYSDLLINYKPLVATRDANSVTETSTPFLSTTGSSADFLKMDASMPTVCSNGGVSISTITDDYFGNVRQGSIGYAGTGTAPDIGANEFELAVACSAPLPGNTIASNAGPSCPSTPILLSLQTPTPGNTVSYQWFKGPTVTGPWTSFGTNAAVQAVTQSVTTFYYCAVTCSVGPVVGNSTPVQVVTALTSACYCTPTVTNNCNFMWTSNVSFGTINNTTACAMFTNYSGTQSTNLNIGTSVPITVTEGASFGNDVCYVWIDWNQNGLFGDVSNELTQLAGQFPFSNNIQVPLTALTGNTYMRVKVSNSGGTNFSAPCGLATFGEVEDYAITVLPAISDLAVTNIYTMGKIPKGYASPHVIKARVYNSGSNVMTNVPVTLSVSAPNAYNNIQTISSINPGNFAIVTFAGFSPNVIGTNTITVSVPSDGNNANNTKTASQDVTTVLYNYKDPSLPITAGVGNNGTGAIAVKFTTANLNGNADTINEVQVEFTTNAVQYQIAVWLDSASAGIPKVVPIYTSPVYNTLSTAAAFISVPNVIVSGTYYVGVVQPTTTNVGFAYQTESPIRTNVFYFRQSTSVPPNTWLDFGAGPNPFRFAIGVQMFIPAPPNCVVHQAPAANGIACPTGTNIAWASGGGGPTSYDVYLSTNKSLVVNLDSSISGARVSTRQAGLTYASGALTPGMKYYWNIVATNSFGNTATANCGIDSFTSTIVGCYCGGTPPPSGGGGYCINTVTISTINNTTAGCQVNGGNNYSYQLATTDLVQGGNSFITVSTSLVSNVSVWIDYDHNFIFDATEWTQVYASGTTGGANINIPAAALLGNTVMRIRSNITANPNGATDGCTNMGFGETEDYIVNIIAQIANDNPIGAIELTPGVSCSNISGTTIGGSGPSAGVAAACIGYTADDDVWYRFKTNNAAALITVTPDPGMDAAVQLFSGPNRNSLSLLSANCTNSGGNGVTENAYAMALNYLPVADSVWVRVFHFGAGSGTGSFQICVESNSAPANDSCGGAINLTLYPTCNNLSYSSAWSSISTVIGCSGVNDDDVWFKVNKPQSLITMTVKVTGVGNYDPAYEVLSGSCGTMTSHFCRNSNSGTNNAIESAQVSFPSAAGTYYIRVYDARLAWGDGNFDICVFGTVPAPTNDNPCTGTNVSGNSGSVANTTQVISYDGGSSLFAGTINTPTANPPIAPNLVYYNGSTAFAGNMGINEPTPLCGLPGASPHSVWYSFNAPSFGAFDIVLRTAYLPNTTFSTLMTAYSVSGAICGAPTFTQIPGATCSATGTLTLTSSDLAPFAGQQVYVQLMGNGLTSPSGNFRLSLQAVAPGISATSVNTSSVQLNFPTVAGMTTFKLYHRKVGNTGYVITNITGNPTSYTLGGLVSGDSYLAWVSYSNGVQTFFSHTEQFTTTVGCAGSVAAPSEAPVVGHCAQRLISWPTHPLAAVSFPYRLYSWKPSTSSFYVVALNTTSFTLSSLALNTAYNAYYKVICNGGAQVNSGVANYTTCAGPAKEENPVKEDFIVWHNGIQFVNPTIEDLSIIAEGVDLSDGQPHVIAANGLTEAPNAAIKAATTSVSKEFVFEIVPNPNAGQFMIHLNENLKIEEELTVSIFNASGSRVMTEKVRKPNNENQISLSLADYKEGVYLVTIQNAQFSQTKKLVIAR